MNLRLLLSSVIAAACLFFIASTSNILQPPSKGELNSSTEDDAGGRTDWDLMRLADPATGKIPDHIRNDEVAFAQQLPKATVGEGSRTGRFAGMPSL